MLAMLCSKAAIKRQTLCFDWKIAIGVQKRLLQLKRSVVQLDLVAYRLFHRQ